MILSTLGLVRQSSNLLPIVLDMIEERNSTLKTRGVSLKGIPNTHQNLLNSKSLYCQDRTLQNEQPTYRVDTMQQQELETKRKLGSECNEIRGRKTYCVPVESLLNHQH